MNLAARTAALIVLAATALHAQKRRAPSNRLYLWTASADTAQPDFLAVLDVRPGSRHYGRLIATVPVPGRRNGPHHTEHAMPADGRLFANGFRSGQTFIFDLRGAARPRLGAQFGDVAGMMHPHSFLRLANGHVLATFQMQHDSLGMAPGGIAELTPRGRLVRATSANVPGTDRRLRPYSAAIIPKLDRIVTTTSDMDDAAGPTQAVQVWRLSDLALLHTFDLPHGPRGDEGALTAEPRLLADGRTVLVSTFNCGLYLLDDVAGTPSARLVSSFPRKKDTDCAIPVIAGHYYLVTVPAWNAVVSLDIADPSAPKEVSRLVLQSGDVPHWISLEPNHRRLVVTGFGVMKNRVVLARFDETTGQLSLDPDFHDEGSTEPGVRMDNKTWPHGGSAAGIPHGAVFSH